MTTEILFWVMILAIILLVFWPSKAKQKPRSRAIIRIVLRIGDKKMTPISGQIASTQKVQVTANFTDALGMERPLASTPVWKSSDTTIATVTADPTGLTAEIVAVAPGTAMVTVTAEGDPTAGKDTIDGEVDITVVAPEDTQVTLTLGTPESQ